MPNDQLIVDTLRCQDDTEIGYITLNSPETLNSLTLDMVNEISDLLDQWEFDPKIKIILISGAGEKAFCAGETSEPSTNQCVLQKDRFLPKHFLNRNIDWTIKSIISLNQ